MLNKSQYRFITNWIGRIINFKYKIISPDFSIGSFTFKTDLNTTIHCKVYGKRLVDKIEHIPNWEDILIHRSYNDENGSIVNKIIDPLGNEIISNKGSEVI